MQSTDYHGPWIMSAIIEDRAERLGDRAAIHTLSGSITYAELRDRAQRVAAQLIALGVQPGDRVATMIDATPDYVSAWLGCAWAGAIEVPINTEYKGTFLEHVLRESGAVVLLAQAAYVDRVAPLVAPDLRHVIVVGGEDRGLLSGKNIATHTLSDAISFDPAPMSPRTEQDLLYVLYTSGTTGMSKGVVHCNRSALWTARVWKELGDLGPDDVGYSYLPLYHVTARSALVKACVLAGGACVLRPHFSASEFWPDVRRYGATFTMYMGAVILFLTKQAEIAGELDNTLRIAGGAACPPAVAADFERRFGCKLLEVYGMTEIGTATGPRGGRIAPGTMGRAFDHLEIAIHDPDDERLPAGELGEIVVRPNEPFAMMQGYWNQPQATVESWKNLWFHTGDIGRMTPDGDVIYVDRLKDSLRRRGENISSFEIERAVQDHPAIQECAAFAVASEATEDDVMIAVLLRPDHGLAADDLFDFCEGAMPRFAVPRYLRFVSELPKTPTNRVQKHVLRAAGVTPDTFERQTRRKHA